MTTYVSNYVSKPYKINLLGPTGNNISLIFGEENQQRVLFSQTEMESLPNIVYTQQRIYEDDTIYEIKRKILEEIQSAGLGKFELDDLYLFATVYRKKHRERLLDIFKEFHSKQSEKTLSRILSNIGFSKEEIQEGTLTIENMDKWNMDQLQIPLGLKSESWESSILIPVNPLDAEAESEATQEKSVWTLHQNEVLLDYGSLITPIIQVCFKGDVSNPNSQSLYFPPSSGSGGMTSVMNVQQSALKKIHDIYELGGKKTIPYSKEGIVHIELELINDERAVLPLDVVFKNIHANSYAPFVKFKQPHIHSLYRLFSKEQNKQGEKIPALLKNDVLRMDRENPHSLTLVFATTPEIVVTLLKNGNIRIRMDAIQPPLPIDKIESLLLHQVNPMIVDLNQYLEPTGFAFGVFTSFDDNQLVKIVNMKWVLSVPLDDVPSNKQVLKVKQLNSLKAAFIPLTMDSERKITKMEMRFRRVSNYNYLYEIRDKLKAEMLGRKKTNQQIVQEIQLLGYSEETIRQVLNDILNEGPEPEKKYFQKKEWVAGFPTRFHKQGNECHIEIENITSVQYIPLLKMYIDTFFHTAFFHEDIPAHLLDFSDISKIKPAEQVLDLHAPEGEEEEEVQGKKKEEGEEEEEEREGEEEEEREGEEEEEEDNDEYMGVMLENESDEEEEESEQEEENESVNEKEESEPEESGSEGVMLSNSSFNESESKGGKKGDKPTKAFSILDRLQKREPEMFSSTDKKEKVYSRICPGHVSRYPVIITDEEKQRIDTKDKQNAPSYTEALKYRNYSYICPRFWNFRENRSMSQEEFEKDPDLKKHIIVNEKDPDNEMEGRFIYEFKKGKRFDEKNQYKEHYPGITAKNEKGICLPCCFSQKDTTFYEKINDCGAESREAETDATAAPATAATAIAPAVSAAESAPAPTKDAAMNPNKDYVLDYQIFPLRNKRWGKLPPPIERLIQRSSKSPKPSSSSPSSPYNTQLLRHGIENHPQQSFLSCLADLYGSSSWKEMKQVMVNAFTLDKFLQYQNGSLVASFKKNASASAATEAAAISTEKYQNTLFYKSLDLNEPVEYDFLMETLVAYENFLDYLQDDSVWIDYEYLWDFLSTPDPLLFPKGLNLLILTMEKNEDEQIHLTCPTHMSSNMGLYDPAKPSWVLIQRPLLSGSPYFEPIYLVNQNKYIPIHRAKYVKTFDAAALQQYFPFVPLLDTDACRPTERKGKPTVSAAFVYEQCTQKGFQINKQVVNPAGKTFGLVVSKYPGIKNVFVPCLPSPTLVQPLIMKIQDTVRREISMDYSTAKDMLGRIQQATGIPCAPVSKLVGMEEPLVFGLYTSYDGFVPIEPKIATSDTEDDLPIMSSSDPMEADMSMIVSSQREDPSRMYYLESQFYLAFQGRMRGLLNEYVHENQKKQIVSWIETEDNRFSLAFRLEKILPMLKKMAKGRILFQDFEERVLLSLQNIYNCPKGVAAAGAGPYCLVRRGQDAMIFPKQNLVNVGENNEDAYFVKLADALLRNRRIQNILLQPYRFFNLLNSEEYLLNGDEMMVAENYLKEIWKEDRSPFF